MVGLYVRANRGRVGEVGMKGFIDENGFDRSPCGLCKYKNKMTVEQPCYSCISIIDLALHKQNHETEFASFVPADGQEVKQE